MRLTLWPTSRMGRLLTMTPFRHYSLSVISLLAAFLSTSCRAPGEEISLDRIKGNSWVGKKTTELVSADIVLQNAKIYTFAWSQPSGEGKSAGDAPLGPEGWKPEAQSIALRNGTILAIGSDKEVARHISSETRVINISGNTVLPGFVDSHTHVGEVAAQQGQLDLRGEQSMEQLREKIRMAVQNLPDEQWVIAWGLDDADWSTRWSNIGELAKIAGNHPVFIRGLHGFVGWASPAALAKLGFEKKNSDPKGGTVVRNKRGVATGVLLNQAIREAEHKIPKPSNDQFKRGILGQLNRMASRGYVAIHEAGVSAAELNVLMELDAKKRLPIRVYAMLDGSDAVLLDTWIDRGPRNEQQDSMLTVRSVKAFYDGSLGVRGASLLEDYSDQPGQRGVGGEDYGFDSTRIKKAMKAGFQVAIHAIGDAANREVLDFYEKAFKEDPKLKENRHRIEHAQVVAPVDQARFAALGIIASMQPHHATEDMVWAEKRLGQARTNHAYAWRSLRENRVRLIFSSDMPGSSSEIVYGLHAAVTRKDRNQNPADGWHIEQALTIEESIFAYTLNNRFASFSDDISGKLAPGMRADLTVFNIDLLESAEKDPKSLLAGKPVMTIVGGKVVSDHL